MGKGNVAKDWRTPEGKGKDYESRKRAMQHLLAAAGPDLTLLILRGHLLVEEKLYDFLKTAVPHPAAIDRADLNFYKALCVAEAILPYEEPEMWEAIRKLNKLRNDIAHNIETKDIEARIKEVVPPDLDMTVPLFFRNGHGEAVGLLGASVFWTVQKLSTLAQVMLAYRHIADDAVRNNREAFVADIKTRIND